VEADYHQATGIADASARGGKVEQKITGATPQPKRFTEVGLSTAITKNYKTSDAQP